ncbi:hypothetical protein OPQ81_005152 [Rhizoctonia solani]|nr:hypothetical protein OPQ81_005152 [Rhizoctonia solani]
MVVDPRTQMRKSLRNLPVDGTLDSLTITLPCRHVFTVAALDDALGLSEFYEKGERGEWSKPSLPGGVRTQATCPTCNGRVDSLRYGRLVKSSRLALLQHHVAVGLSRQLAEVDTRLALVQEEVIPAVDNNILASVLSQPLQTGSPMHNASAILNASLSKNQTFQQSQKP